MKKENKVSLIKKKLDLNENEQCKLVTVTPEIANFLLTFNTNNRPISYKRVSIYSEIMEKKDWTLTNDMITFNSKGVLTNGQHRLYAVEKSKVPCSFFIAFNVENSMGMDNGKSRSLSDNLVLFDGCNEILREAKLVHRTLRTMLFINKGSYAANYIPPTNIVKLMNKYEEKLIDLVNAGVISRQWRSKTSQCSVLASFVLAYLNGVPIETLSNIREVLDTGIAKTEYDYPIIALRDRLYTLVGTGRAIETMRATYTQYCIKKISEHSTVKHCRVGSFYYTYDFSSRN